MEDKVLIDEFINFLREKNFSEYTILNYQKDIDDFLDFIRSEKMAPSLSKVTRQRIASNYISYLSNKN